MALESLISGIERSPDFGLGQLNSPRKTVQNTWAADDLKGWVITAGKSLSVPSN
jgi:hypothetical protein